MYAHVARLQAGQPRRDRHRAAGERLPRRHQRRAVRRPDHGHVHRRRDRPAATSLLTLSKRRRRRRTSSCATTRWAQAGRGGRHRPAHRRDPGAGLDAQLRPEPAGQPRHRRRPRRRTTSWTRTRTSRCSNRALAETLPAGLDVQGRRRPRPRWQNGVTPGHRRSRPARATPPPDLGTPIRNAPGVDLPRRRRSPCSNALTESCNTAFAQLGVDSSAPTSSRQTAQAFGFEQDDLTVGQLDEDGCRVAASQTGDMQTPGRQRRPGRAGPVLRSASTTSRMTPLQGAMIAAAIANNGSADAAVPGRQLHGAGPAPPIYTRAARRSCARRSAAQVAERPAAR